MHTSPLAGAGRLKGLIGAGHIKAAPLQTARCLSHTMQHYSETKQELICGTFTRRFISAASLHVLSSSDSPSGSLSVSDTTSHAVDAILNIHVLHLMHLSGCFPPKITFIFKFNRFKI